MKQHSPRIAFLTMLAFSFARTATAEVMPLQNISMDFALNPATGVLAAVEMDKNQVTFYPKALTGQAVETSSETVPRGPVAILYKKYGDAAYFIVLSHVDRKLTLIDAKGLTTTKEILLSTESVGTLQVSNASDDPYIYIPQKNESPTQDTSEAMVVDLRVQKDLGGV